MFYIVEPLLLSNATVSCPIRILHLSFLESTKYNFKYVKDQWPRKGGRQGRCALGAQHQGVTPPS